MLLWQLLFTLLYCLLCNLFQTVFATSNNVNLNNIDEVCDQLVIQYENNNIMLQKESYSLYNKSVWSNEDNNIFASYDGWTNSWEIMLPTTTNPPNIYRVQSNQIIPPSTIWTNKWTQNQIYIHYLCQSQTTLPTAQPTTQPLQPKIFTNYSVSVEFKVKYDEVDDLCPSDDEFGDYFLELSTCQVFDIDVRYCFIESITTQSILTTHNTSRRRLVGNNPDDEFIIYISMQISAEDTTNFEYIKRDINTHTFAENVDQKWQLNAANAHRRIVVIFTKDANIGDGVHIGDVQSKESIFNMEEMIGMVFGILAVLICICVVYCWKKTSCGHKNAKQVAYDSVSSLERVVSAPDEDAEFDAILQMNGYAEFEGFCGKKTSCGHKSAKQDDQHSEGMTDVETHEEQEQDDNDDDNVSLSSLEHVASAPSQLYQAAFDNKHISNDNRYAKFEDSDLISRGVEVIGNATSCICGGRIYDRTHEFVLQYGPVISQAQSKKYQELMEEKNFLNRLERQLNDIQQY